jgi:hypothetical protein
MKLPKAVIGQLKEERKNRFKELRCKHYKGDGYDYPIVGATILLCKNCERKMRKAVLEQDALERKLKEGD